MEYLILLPFMILMGFLFAKHINSSNNNNSSKSSITRIDDKNWIVNNEFVSFEEDTPLKRFQQEQEDRKHYQAYERDKLQKDRERLWKDWMKTKQAINKYPDLKNCVSDEKLNSITAKYEHYLKMCNKLEEYMILTKEEFLIKEENPAFCVDFTNMLWIRTPIGCYTIFNEKNAKYAHGKMDELISQEFKEKWY